MAAHAGLGSITLGEDFVRAGNHLFENKVEFRHAGPIEYLFAHGLELLLKGGLMLAGKSEQEVETYQHKVLELYDAASTQEPLRGSMNAAENHVKDQWRTRLRDARDAYREKFQKFGITRDDHLKQFGVHDNNTIGSEVPQFRKQVLWLDERHRSEGGLFRYHKTRADQREMVKAFELNDDVVLQSMSWGCRFFSKCIH